MSAERLRRTFWMPTAVGASVSLVTVALGVRQVYPIITFGLAGFVLATILEEFRKGVSARRRISGRSPARALLDLFARNGRRYGGYVVHAGIVVIAVALAISGSWKTDREVTLRKGERIEIGEYTVQLEDVWGREEAQRFVVGATFKTWRGDRYLGEQQPRMNYYQASEQPIGTPAVVTSLTKDLYLTLMAFDGEAGEHATIRVIVNPAVAWLWIGGLIVGFGALIAIWPHGRSSYRPELALSLTADLTADLDVEASPGTDAGATEEGREQVATRGIEG
jgi:cytochrome c-type biogenesis protein CcmF